MSEAKFTPGHWEWVKSKNDNWSSYDLSPGVLTKDTADGTPWGDEIDRANANLIAVAPELYEALELCLSDLRAVTNVVGRGILTDKAIASATAALAKARGER